MRSEIENIVLREGWSGPHRLDKFRKIDSFIKETMRINGLSARKCFNNAAFKLLNLLPF